MRESTKPPLYSEAVGALEVLDTLLEGPDSLQRAKQLVQALLSHPERFLLYLGAGCSMSVHTKSTPAGGKATYAGVSWNDLLDELSKYQGEPKRREILDAIHDRAEGSGDSRARKDLQTAAPLFDKLQLAWFLGSGFNDRVARDRAIAAIVEPPDDESRSSDLFEGLLHLPFRDLITTNYDSNALYFLERRDIKVNEIFDRSSLARSFSGPTLPRLFYLHGKAGRSELVLDRFDYGRLLAERDGLFDFVTYLMRDSHAVYVGFSLDDPSFNLMETRLFSLDVHSRPESFAFVSKATAAEHTMWAARNLFLIQYRDHASLPKIIQHVGTLVRFMRETEGDLRPSDAPPDRDRTQGYLAEALQAYVVGDFETCHRRARAGLASTLFWTMKRTTASDKRNPAFADFYRASRVCQIRIRLALTHYKMRLDAQNPEDHHRHLKINLRAAKEIIRACAGVEKLKKLEDLVGDARDWIPFRDSARLLDARLLYAKGKYKKARDVYEAVVTSSEGFLTEIEKRCEDLPIRRNVLSKMRCCETYYYASCQKSRIDYQLIDADPDDLRSVRWNEADTMRDLARRVENEVGKGPPSDACRDEAEYYYFLQSLLNIALIARWTGGRHKAGVFLGVLPTRDERTDANREAVDDAIQRLEFDENDQLALPFLQELMERGRRGPAASWRAERERYLARAKTLRWLLGVRKGGCAATADLRDAFQHLQRGMEHATGSGMERHRVVNSLESVRLNVLVLFGQRIVRPSTAAEASPLTVSAAAHYLDDAFRRMGELRESKKRVHVDWLEALGLSLAAYLSLLTMEKGRYGGPRPSDPKIASFLGEKPEVQYESVHTLYAQMSETVGEMSRAALFEKTYKGVRSELDP